jgi:hypothetical protein
MKLRLLVGLSLTLGVTSLAFPTPEDWTAEADFLLMTRFGVDEVLIVGDGGTTSGEAADDASLLTTDDFEFGFEPGISATIARQLSEPAKLELSGFWLNTFSASDSVLGNDNLDVPLEGEPATAAAANPDLDFPATGPTVGFDGAEFVSAAYEADTYGVEVNYHRHLSPSFSALIGFRYLSLDESLEIRSVEGPPGSGASGPWVSEYRVQADNDLFGLQLGVEQSFRLGKRQGTRLILIGKGGIFAAQAEQQNRIEENVKAIVIADPDTNAPIVAGPLVVRDQTESSTEVGFIGEVGLRLSHAVTEALTISAGYQLWALGNVATAPAQLDYRAPVSATGNEVGRETIFYHGAQLGIQGRW